MNSVVIELLSLGKAPLRLLEVEMSSARDVARCQICYASIAASRLSVQRYNALVLIFVLRCDD